MHDWRIQLILVGQIAAAMVLGGVVGWERELADKPAGFRTHMLVAGASALFVGLAAMLTKDFQSILPPGGFRADPVRVLQSVVIGVSFLGAGTVFRSRDNRVGGLTTAASILMAAGVGIACGLSRFILAVGATLLALLVLRLAHRVVGSRKKS
ncbi:MAG TPA: MgtC/SapB family protein [Gammaproteobacteria bacterium]|nr:MgtC/SapB family protein [Gammaproteobacteria bacterium]